MQLLQGDELREIVKGYVAQLQSENLYRDNSNDKQNIELDWVVALRWCPKGLMDLINSKACRGQIP